MFPSKCNAILVSAGLLEYGVASVDTVNKTVSFSANFVPLLKVGTGAQIICTASGQQTHTFSGEVYLSTKKFLRLVNVKCRLLQAAENVLSIESVFSGQITPPRKNKRLPSGGRFPCTVSRISANRLSFQSPQLEIDWTPFSVILHEPIFKKPVKIKVKAGKNSLVFGKSAKYECIITEIAPETLETLKSFIRAESLEIIKNFII